LTSATNPESGTITYKYDENGNLTEKTDARSITTKYKYDALNRNTEVDYSNTSLIPDNKRVYDNPTPGTYGKGRFWFEYARGDFSNGTDTDHIAIGRYDPLGRPLSVRQHFKFNGVWKPGVNEGFTTSVTYDIPGNVKTMTYPSGHTVSYSHDQAGRLTGFNGNLGDGLSRTYSTITQYHPAGMMEREGLGTQTPLYLKRRYNKRLQIGDVRLSTINDATSADRGALLFYYGPNAIASANPFQDDTTNNGNLRRQVHVVPKPTGGGDVQPQIDDYTYDTLNRISGMSQGQIDATGTLVQNVVRQTYGYDQYGNRGITSAIGGVNGYNPTYDQATNRIVALGYDAAGNITSDVMTGGTMTYDAENRLLTATSGGSYAYDAAGKRTRRFAGGPEWWYVYGASGELVAEYNANGAVGSPLKEYGYRNGQMLVVWDGSETGDRKLQWLVQDHLGSTRMVVDRSGSLGGVRRHDFLPFGEELGNGVGIRSAALGYGGDSVRQKYGSYERDDETGLDFAENRYFASLQGRFTSPDNFLNDTHVADPASWNLYSFVRNNPLKYVDPTGERLELTGDEETRRRSFERIKNAIGEEYAKYLSVKEEKGHFYVEYSADGPKFDPKKDDYKTPEEQIAAWVTGIIGHKDTLEFQVSETYTTKDGKARSTEEAAGGHTVSRSDSRTGNVQVFVHPNAGRIATVVAPSLNRLHAGLDFTNEDVDIHEIGHGHAQMLRGWKEDNVKNAEHSVKFENYSRWRRERKSGLQAGTLRRRSGHHHKGS
jgi:RHS repeat-associated protein